MRVAEQSKEGQGRMGTWSFLLSPAQPRQALPRSRLSDRCSPGPDTLCELSPMQRAAPDWSVRLQFLITLGVGKVESKGQAGRAQDGLLTHRMSLCVHLVSEAPA
jgi:hypothetical protein